ncbi:MAG TPA: methyl-accepting chemotaxis protein [Candidatus Tectomicrobia bacterium]|nr:methyl-accepting chemotaxis protein [Candidatus Tectomicrobia bacterium]
MRHFKLSLFNKLLGFLLLCLVCSGAVAVVLIHWQMTDLAYTQLRALFESDVRNLRSFLQAKEAWLLAATRDLAKDELLKTGIELQVFDQVKNIAESHKAAQGFSEVMVINAQKRLVSRGDASRDTLDPNVDAALADKAFGAIQYADLYQLFGQTALSTSDGKPLARVVVMQPLSPAFFQELKTVLGKEAILFAGDREVGSTFAEPPGPLQATSVAPGLFRALRGQFIGTEGDLGDVLGQADWRVVILETAAPLVRSLRRLQWGSVLFVLIFICLIAVVLGLFFVANIRKPLRVIQQGIAAITQGHLETRIHLGRRDEWRLIEEALNLMTQHLGGLITQVQHAGIQVTTSATQLAASGKQLESTVTEQVASTNQVVATTTEIAATSQELAQTMQGIAGVADETATAAASSHAGLARMEATMQQMELATRTIAERLAAIQERAGDITSVVTTITKVADQTNLLSLNAAIEAEKAGEYGRGFAVVAREIRRLADQTAVATLQIERIVNDMRASVTAGVAGMDQFAHEVQEGVEQVRDVGTQLGQIIARVQALTPRFDTVNEGMQAQAEGAQQISEAMEQLREAVQQTATSLQESTNAIAQLNLAAQGLHDEIARFNGQA